MSIALIIPLLAIAAASPLEQGLHYRTVAALEPRQTMPASSCANIKSHCTRANQQRRATSWCASYLGTPIVLETVGPTTTSTVALTCGGSPTTSIVQATADVHRRGAIPITGEPGCLGSHSTASAACSCLSIPSTLTITSTAPLTTITATGPFSLAFSSTEVSSYLSALVQPSLHVSGFQFTTAAHDADHFLLRSDGALIDASHHNWLVYTDNGLPYIESSTFDNEYTQDPSLPCTLDQATCNVSCGSSGDYFFYGLWVFDSESADGMSANPIQLQAHYSSTAAGG